MKRSPQIQSRINAIAKELANGKERDEILRKYAKKWQIAPRTIDRYLNPAKIVAKQLSNLANKVAEDTITAEVKQAVESGLKSKLERVMFYQEQINQMERQLIGQVKTTFVVGNKIINSHTGDVFMMPIQVQNDLRATIKAFQTEISKIQGDYAAIKQAQTDISGNDLPPSGLTDSQFEQFLASARANKTTSGQ